MQCFNFPIVKLYGQLSIKCTESLYICVVSNTGMLGAKECCMYAIVSMARIIWVNDQSSQNFKHVIDEIAWMGYIYMVIKTKHKAHTAGSALAVNVVHVLPEDKPAPVIEIKWF